MNAAVLPGVLVYFGIGWLLSDLIGEDDDALKMFVFVFWPLIIGLLAICLVVMAAMFVVVVATEMAKRISKWVERG